MGKDSKTLEIYRMQSEIQGIHPKLCKHYPVKRVNIGENGEIKFNPDSSKFIYFSKTEKHHAYYIFSKVLKIINSELRKAKDMPQIKSLNLENFRSTEFLNKANYNIIKEVQKFFRDYIPPQYIELVSLKYLEAFSRNFEECAIKNHKKLSASNEPEISDTRFFGGAYGINDAWLELLKSSIVSTSSMSFSMDQFFDFILDSSAVGDVERKSLKPIINSNPQLLDILNISTRKQLENPKFKDKNNINDIKHYLQAIEDYKLYNQEKPLNRQFFAKARHDIQNNYREVRDMGYNN